MLPPGGSFGSETDREFGGAAQGAVTKARVRHAAKVTAVLLTAAACASTEEKPDGPIIDSFVIEGTKNVKPSDIEKHILTSKSSFWTWVPFLGKRLEERFDPNAWIADQRRIERYYQAHGFYQARVLEDEVTPLKEGHVKLKLRVSEGDVTTISRFDIKGLESLTDKESQKVRDGLSPKPGKPFLEEDWAQAQKAITDKLQALGYAAASVDAQATVDVKTLKAELDVQADTGKRYRFGQIQVNDPDGKIPEKIIKENVESAVTPGDWFSPDALKEAQARLFQLGVFSAVKVGRDTPDDETGTVPITADVREAQFETLKFGGGLGADQLRDEIHLAINYQNRNFFGGARRLTLRARAGVEALASTQQAGVFALASVLNKDPGAQVGPFALAHAEFEQPDVLVRWLALQTSLELSHSLEPAYTATGGTAKVGLVARPTSHQTYGLSINPSYYHLTRPPELSTTTTTFYGCPLDCALLYLEQTAAWDRRDKLLEPRHGWYLAVGVQEGDANRLLPDGTSRFDAFYLRVVPEARGYLSVAHELFTFAVRARLGILQSLTGADTAIPARFFSGGNDDRGFSARRLAPYVVAPNTACTRSLGFDQGGGHCSGYGDQLPIGGNTLLDGSFEFRWNVSETWTLATFVDAGYVTKTSLSVEIFRQLNVAVGLGVRYVTPIGPIRVDLAVRLPGIGTPLEQYTVTGYPVVANRGCFLGLGRGSSDVYPGSPEGQCAFHLSIGEAF
jgi:translocation and assembly module TamA